MRSCVNLQRSPYLQLPAKKLLHKLRACSCLPCCNMTRGFVTHEGETEHAMAYVSSRLAELPAWEPLCGSTGN